MGLEKAGLQLGKEIIAWTRSGKSLLTTKPLKVNIEGLRLAPNLEGDVIQISKTNSKWYGKPEKFVPDCSIPNSQVPSHHKIDGWNSNIRDVKDLKNGIVEDCELFGGYKALKIDKEFAKLTPLEKDCIGYRIIGRSPLSEYRNEPFRIIEKAQIGDIVKLDEGCAYAFQQEYLISANNYNLKNSMLEIIRIPKGAKVSRNMEHGGEILMPRGAEYKLVSKETKADGQIEVVLEYILPKSKYSDDIEQIKKIAEMHRNSTDSYNKKFAQKILNEIESL